MKTQKPLIHFVDNYLINPTNPVTVSVIGAGGTGSQVVTALARINYSLTALGHAGIQVKLIDDDIVGIANIGRQLFAESEIGLFKSVALINRMNRFFGTNWKAITEKITNDSLIENWSAQIIISCVDTIAARFTIAELLSKSSNQNDFLFRPIYWLDFGNNQHTGQVIVSTVNQVKQPSSQKFKPVHSLPAITTEYRNELKTTKENRLPSCSLAEALHSQDLFVNSTLANLGCSLLWKMFREGMIAYRGLFLNLKTLQSQPIALL